MKKLLSIFLLFALSIQCAGNLWTIGIFYLQQDFISNNICVNRFDKIPVCKGQCYLNKQLSENEKQQEKPSCSYQSELQLYYQEPTKQLTNLDVIIISKICHELFQDYGKPDFYGSLDHPPESLA